MPDDVAHALAPLTALDDSARPVRLGTLWAERPAVVVFIRQFG